MRSIRLLMLAGLAGAGAAPLRAQERAAPDSVPAAASAYTSFSFESQLTVESFLQGGRVAGEIGRVWPRGRSGAWLPQLSAALSLLPGNRFLDGLALGPRVSFARALPIGFVLGPRDRAVVLGVSGLVDGTWRFAGLQAERGTRLEPAIRGSAGYRFRPDRASWYTSLRVLVEGRRHTAGPTVYLDLGLERPGSRPQT